jgi:hypothetical protein
MGVETTTDIQTELIDIFVEGDMCELHSVVERLNLVLADARDVFLFFALHPEHDKEEADAAGDVTAHGEPQKVLALSSYTVSPSVSHAFLPSSSFLLSN